MVLYSKAKVGTLLLELLQFLKLKIRIPNVLSPFGLALMVSASSASHSGAEDKSSSGQTHFGLVLTKLSTGYSCQGGAIWQTGLTWYGDGRMENWYEWYPEPPSAYPEPFSASAGDKVKMTVHADSPTSGNSTLENLTTGQSVSIQHSNMQQQLCLQDADWVLEDFEQKELADFGSFTFTDTVANGENGPSNPEGATIVEVEADGQEKTRCRSDANSVTCEYAGN